MPSKLQFFSKINIYLKSNKIKKGQGNIMVFAKTDIGKVREINQDYYYISDDTKMPKIYILADGMGRI